MLQSAGHAWRQHINGEERRVGGHALPIIKDELLDKPPTNYFDESFFKMSVENPSDIPISMDHGNVFDDVSHSYKLSQQSPKRHIHRKQNPFFLRFGTDSFLPCVVLTKKKTRPSPAVAVNVTTVGISATKHPPSRHANRRASMGVIKEGGDDAAQWAEQSQHRRTSLPPTFHSARKQNVITSVLVDSSVITELHSALNELSIVTSSGDQQAGQCAARIQKLLKPYEKENLLPSQVVWLHDSLSSPSDEEENASRELRGSFNKRATTRRQEWNPDNVFTTTTSATGLPSQDPGPVRSKRLPKLKTPSCSSPTGGREIGKLVRRRTIHSIGSTSTAGFASSDYESCDNILTDGSEGETVKQMPDLQQPNAGRSERSSSYDAEAMIRLPAEATIDEEGSGGSDRRSSNTSSSADSNDEDRISSGSVLSLDGKEEGLGIQQIFNGVEYKAELLENVSSWNFPIFDLANETHCVLSQMAYKLFDDTGLFETFRIPRKPFVDYMRALENGYWSIPYHNRIHASDVLHGCWFLTTQQIPGFSETSPTFSTSSSSSDSDSGTAHTQVNSVGNGSLAQAIPALELMALYLAAAMHDYDHPGRTNAFLVETRHPLAMLYNDRSVLENHHASASWELLHSNPAYNFLENLDVPEWKRLRFLIVESILATDLKKHFELMSKFSSKIAQQTHTNSEGMESLRLEDCLTWSSDEDRLLVCQMVIKLSDISGPTKIRDLHVTWTRAICQEFFTQGDEERKRRFAVSPFMDRENPQVAQLQRTFIKNLIAPLVCKMHRAGVLAGFVGDSAAERGEKDNILEPMEDGVVVSRRSLIREQLADNLRYWQEILQREMDGHEEMEEVFECCHKVTLEHDDFDATDVDFPKNLMEKRQNILKHFKENSDTKSPSFSGNKQFSQSKSEIFLRNFSRPNSSAVCNKKRERTKSS